MREICRDNTALQACESTKKNQWIWNYSNTSHIAEPFNVRMRHLEANTGNLETAERLRLALVEERLLRIEGVVLGGKKWPAGDGSDK